MIRELQIEDMAAIIRMVQMGCGLSARTITDRLTSTGTRALVWESESQSESASASGTGIEGCACISEPDDWGDNKVSKGYVFTALGSRNKGIGGSLWQALEPYISQAGATQVHVIYRSDVGRASEFFSARGFRPWFTLDELIYAGPSFTEPVLDGRLTASQYEDRWFTEYLETINVCFREMREANDIHPVIIHSPEAFTDEKLRRRLVDNSGNTWVFLSEGRFIGLGELESPKDSDGNAVDTLAVHPDFQRQGYGKLITKFMLNRLLERGYLPAHIAVVATNTHVRRLYESVGCTYTMSYERARLNIKSTLV